MAAGVPLFFADGTQLVERGPDTDDDQSLPTSRPSRSSRAKAKAGNQPVGRSKRGKGTMLSSSFTSWRLTPVTDLELSQHVSMWEHV